MGEFYADPTRLSRFISRDDVTISTTDSPLRKLLLAGRRSRQPILSPPASHAYNRKRNPPTTHPAAKRTRRIKRVIVEIQGLKKIYEGKQRVTAVDGIDLNVREGELYGLLGPNGAGKTTCFYIITGLISADIGVVTLDGHDITSLPMYRRSRLGIGYLPQEASIFRGLNVEQNIRAVLEVFEPVVDTREAMLDELLAEFSISHLRRTPSLALSGGERRRVEIARALAGQPHFILLDEPLAGIDPIAVNDIRELVRHLKTRGIGVLITDHNVRETLDIVDRAYILHDGQVLREGSPAEIVADANVRRVYLGERFSL
jgi:lipopolysaccharide export system ATP-binding protein